MLFQVSFPYFVHKIGNSFNGDFETGFFHGESNADKVFVTLSAVSWSEYRRNFYFTEHPVDEIFRFKS